MRVRLRGHRGLRLLFALLLTREIIAFGCKVAVPLVVAAMAVR